MRELFVIPPKGEQDDKYYHEKLDAFTRHHVKLNEYIANNSFSIEEHASTYLQGVALALRNYCVIVVDGYEFIVYLPLNITEEQYDWFKRNNDVIKHMDVSAVSMMYEDKEYTIKHIDKNEVKRNSSNRLYKELKKKLKVEKEVGIDDNQKCR